MTLDEFIRKRGEDQSATSLRCNPFGHEAGGEFLDPWTAGFRRIEFFTRYRGVSDFSDTGGIRIRVNPVPGAGAPPGETEHHWTGRINRYAAEAALMRTYEMLTDAELRGFLDDFGPSLTFCYNDGGYTELTVRYERGDWRVVQNQECG